MQLLQRGLAAFVKKVLLAKTTEEEKEIMTLQYHQCDSVRGHRHEAIQHASTHNSGSLAGIHDRKSPQSPGQGGELTRCEKRPNLVFREQDTTQRTTWRDGAWTGGRWEDADEGGPGVGVVC